MKPTIIALALALVASVAAEETPYPMRDVDPNSEKFAKILNQVASQETAKKRQRHYKVISKIKEGEYVVEEMFASSVTSSLGSVGGGGRVATRWRESGDIYWLPHAESFADGEMISGAYEKTSETFEYTTLLGGKKTVRKLQSDVVVIDKGAFLKALQNGEKFKISMGEKKTRCKDCGGFGRISAPNDPRKDASGKAPCKACDGDGFLEEPQVFVIQW